MQLLIILISGLIIGFVAELTFRSLKNKKIIIPNFYSLILYTLTALFLYAIYELKIIFFIKIILIVIFTTGLEFLLGYWLKKYKNIILWEYFRHRFNYQGLICPLFSFYWLLLSLGYYYFILPALLKF